MLPQENAQTLEAFKGGTVAGAWVPEPWATRLITEGGGHVLVDERYLWPDRQYVTVHLHVRTEFLKAHPDAVRGLITGEEDAIAWIADHPDDAHGVVNDGIAKVTSKKMSAGLLAAAWPNLTFTVDPIAQALGKSVKDAAGVGLLDLEGVDLAGLYDLTILNELQAAHGKPPIAALR